MLLDSYCGWLEANLSLSAGVYQFEMVFSTGRTAREAWDGRWRVVRAAAVVVSLVAGTLLTVLGSLLALFLLVATRPPRRLFGRPSSQKPLRWRWGAIKVEGRPIAGAQRPGRALRLTIGALLVSAGLGSVASPVYGHINGVGNSGIDQAAGPLAGGATYSGLFATPDDIDYYHFVTSRPMERLHFTVSNTLQTCSPPGLNYCSVYATLIDPAGNQLGGEGSEAGTGEVDFGDSDTIDWTFPTPGKYHLVFDSNGDLPGYQFEFHSADANNPGTSGSGTGSTGPGSRHLFRSLKVHSPQRGNVVRANVKVLAEGATVRARLTIGGPNSRVVAGRFNRRSVPAGRIQLQIPLTHSALRALARAGRLRLSLRLSVSVPGSGSATASRYLTLRARR